MLLCIICIFARVSHAEEKPRAPMKVGVLGGFSGPGASYGNAVRNGIELAREETGAPHLEFIYEDDQFISSKTMLAFKKLADIDKVDALMVVGSGSTAVIAPLAEEKKIPLLGWASDARTALNRPHVLRTYMSGYAEGVRAGQEAVKRGFARSVVAISTGDYAQSVREGILSTLPKERVLSSNEFLPEERDYKTLIAKSLHSGADAFYLCLWPGALSSFARQLRELGGHTALYGCETMHVLDEVKSANGALEGAWFIAAKTTPGFHARYMDRFHNDDIISGAAIHYDLTKLLNELEPTITDRSKLVEMLLKSGRHQGAIGTYEFMAKDGDQHMEIELGVQEVTKDGFRELPQDE